MTLEGQILMEKWDAGLLRQEADTHQQCRNIVELEVLESRRQLRLTVNQLIRLASNPAHTTSEIQQQLRLSVAAFGDQLAIQLVRSLDRDDPHERQCIVWLLTLLNDTETVPPLQRMSRNKRLPRSIRLSAALTLAGMGETAETKEENRRIRLFAIS
jgi:hypothetical protein